MTAYEPFNIYRNVFIPVGLYHWTRHQLTYGTPLNRRFTMRFFECFGSYYNTSLNEARVRWNYRPDSDLYIIYTAGQRFARLETNAPQYYQNSLTAKLTYSCRP